MNSPSIEDLISLIFTVTRLVKEKTVMAGKISPLSIVQLKILSVVSKHEAPTMKDIADSLFITSPSATVAINNLVKDGQLERVPDKIDRSFIRLNMTD
jgi:DNA-binding MarR family transcriptional regulator